MTKRIYTVKDKTGVDEPRMVKATSQATAISHVVGGRYVASVANALEVHAMTEAGTKLETAGEASQDDA